MHNLQARATKINPEYIYEPGTGDLILRRMAACGLTVFNSRLDLMELEGLSESSIAGSLPVNNRQGYVPNR